MMSGKVKSYQLMYQSIFFLIMLFYSEVVCESSIDDVSSREKNEFFTTVLPYLETTIGFQEKKQLDYLAATANMEESNLSDKKIASHLYSRPKYDECLSEAKCELLEDSSCLGVHLPYSHTSLFLSNLTSQRAAKEVLEQLTMLKNLPQCWSVVQPFLCSVLFPKCMNGFVQLPSQEMCAITRAPCMLMEQERGWPEYLKCRKEFPNIKCKNSARELPYNTTGECLPPLVNTTEPKHFHEGIRGCGIQCSHPSLKTQEQKDLQSFIRLFGGICLTCSALTVLPFMQPVWKIKSSNKYPAVIVFYINVCFLMTSIGFMIQFYGEARNQILCHADGTLNSGLNDKSSLCYVVFLLIYSFMIAAGVWSIILAYACYKSATSLVVGECQRSLEKHQIYFHIFGWFIPCLLALGTAFIWPIMKPDPSSGICFLDDSLPVRVLALLVPFSIFVCVGEVFIIRALNSLIKMKLESSNVLSDHANKKIKWNILRLLVHSLALLVFLIITFYFHIHMFGNQQQWQHSFKRYIMCVIRLSDELNCSMLNRPSVELYRLHLGAVFGAGILMSLWCCTLNSLNVWRKFFKRVFDVGGDQPVKLTKHKLIAQAFAKRNDLNTAGRLSISLKSLNSDPLGLNFELNSATSENISSVWAAAIPSLMNRRGAVWTLPPFAFRRNSADSQYSISSSSLQDSAAPTYQQHSRRHSLDSQMSFHVSDVERSAARKTAARFGRKRRLRNFLSLRKRRKRQIYDRRNSNTSEESNMGSMVLPNLSLSNTDSLFTTIMKRLNLSGDEQPATTICTKKDLCADSEDEAVFSPSAVKFSRKFNRFKKRCVSNEKLSIPMEKVKLQPKVDCHPRVVVKASVGVQTSLESLNGCRIMMEDKSCQVNTPLLSRTVSDETHQTDSIHSLSENGMIAVTENSSSLSFETDVRSDSSNHKPLMPMSQSLIAMKSDYKTRRKKRSVSENEATHCILNMEL